MKDGNHIYISTFNGCTVEVWEWIHSNQYHIVMPQCMTSVSSLLSRMVHRCLAPSPVFDISKQKCRLPTPTYSCICISTFTFGTWSPVSRLRLVERLYYITWRSRFGFSLLPHGVGLWYFDFSDPKLAHYKYLMHSEYSILRPSLLITLNKTYQRKKKKKISKTLPFFISNKLWVFHFTKVHCILVFH